MREINKTKSLIFFSIITLFSGMYGSVHAAIGDGSMNSTVEVGGATTDAYGISVANIGDLNDDGVTDIAVGAPGNDSGGTDRGALYIKFMNADASVKSTAQINNLTTNGPTLANSDYYGQSVEGIGDLNNDGIEDTAVGAIYNDTGGTDRGAIFIHFMNTNGSIKSTVKIGSATTNGPTLVNGDLYGASIANIGDLDGDGIQDIAVGALYDDTGGDSRGATYIHFMNTNGSIKSTVKIGSATTNGPILTNGDAYGRSVANIGDLDGDGIQDIAVGSQFDDAGGTDRGAVHIHFMNTNGSIKSTVEINSSTANGPTLADSVYYGSSVSGLGDLNGDGINDIAVSSPYAASTGIRRGAVHIHFLHTNGSVEFTVQVNGQTANGPTLLDNDYYGQGVENLGDLDGNGVRDIAVSSAGDDPYGTVHIHFMKSLLSQPSLETQSISSITSNAAVGNGSITATGGENPTRYIEWGTASGAYTNSCSAGIGSVGVYSCSMNDLSPNTMYYVRAKATNSVGTSYGSEVSFTTSTAISVVSTQAPTVIMSDGAVGNGTLISTGGENPERYIEWRTVSESYANQCSAGIGESGAYACNMTMLIPNTTYYYRAKATNSAGTSYGNEMIFTTIGDVTIPDPDAAKMTDSINVGYMTILSGDMNNAVQVETNVQVTFRTTNADAIVPPNTTITKTDGGSFDFAQFVTTDVTETVRQENYKTLSAVKVGVPNISLTFSQPITMTLAVDSSHNGEILQVKYQNDGETSWNDFTTCTITDSLCSFQTDHLTTYVVVDGEISGFTSNQLSATIGENMTLSCGTDVDLNGGTPLIPQTPATSQTTCTVTTNDQNGHDLQLTNDRGLNNTLYHNTQFATTDGQITDKARWNPSSPNATNFTGTGLAFGVVDSNATKNTTWWGDATTCSSTEQLYAGVPAVTSVIMEHSDYSNTPTDTTICYQVNVPSTQISGLYEGSVTYTATGRP